jgi:DNA repair protein RecO (recombination protein O)
MMRLTTPGIVLSLHVHGEHGAVVRLMTPEHGLQAAYVRGARGRRMRPVLIAGNRVEAALSGRTEHHLPHATIELVESRASLMEEPLAAASIAWLTALTATALPESQPYPRLFQALDAVLSAIAAAPTARAWGSALVRYELLLLAELGFGIDLSQCAVTGSEEDLVAVSPRSGRAVSAGAAAPYREQLLPLPAFIRAGGAGDWPAIIDGLTLSRHFLARDVLTERAEPLLAARDRLLERLRRAAGLS